MEHEQHSAEPPKQPGWRPASVWKVIGITAAVAAVVLGLGFVGYVALVAWAFSSYGSNK